MRSYNLLIFVLIVMSCKKPYNPPVISSSNSYLVVEGVINSGSDSTIIKLSKTFALSSSVTANPVTQATLTVESDNNNIYPLKEIKAGRYVSPGLNLDVAKRYRLRIKTIDNQQYLSDFVPVKTTPPIDSIGFNITGSGLQLYANTHDATNNTRYYRWDFEETWQFHPKYQSSYITNGKEIVGRQPSQDIYTCFGSDSSSSIIIGSSAKLQQDIIYQTPVTNIPSTSLKIETKYSILLHEYALSGDAYSFWTNLKKNTEQLGSVFDAQPSQITGNIHNINNTAEPVIGYISACTVSTKRIFISNSQLPYWVPAYPDACTADTFYFSQPQTGINQVGEFMIPIPPGKLALYPFSKPGTSTLGYLGTDPACADCTLTGRKQQPPFWK
ncbi:MAG: hypothetical protein JWP44_2898 [Mucilaginibacter sp.]|nr:hypothetical protein [Mucilaginibacter sp.]